MNNQTDAFTPALIAMKERRWLEANALWLKYREKYQESLFPWTEAAKCLIQLKDFDGAEKLLQHARAKHPNNASVWLISADIARQKNTPDLEIKILKEGISNCPKNWEIYYWIAEHYLEKNDLPSSQENNEKARTLNNKNIKPIIQQAKLSERQQDLEKAERILHEAINNFPNNKIPYKNLSQIYQAQGKTQQAKRYRLAADFGKEVLGTTEPPLTPISKAKSLEQIIHFTQLVLTKSIMGVKSESARTKLNYAWIVIEPLLHLTIYYFLFGKLLHAGTENYGLFLLCGLVPWMWFSKSISISATSIISGQSLMLTTNISPVFFPLAAITQSTLKQLPALLCLLALGMTTDLNKISWSLLWLPLIMLTQLLLTAGISLTIAAIIPFVRDLANLIGTGLTLLMFLSGVIFNYNNMPNQVAEILKLNPLATLISSYRTVLLESSHPNAWSLGYTLIFSLFLIIASTIFYHRYGQIFVRQGMR